MPERAKSLSEVFNSFTARDSAFRFMTSGLALGAVEIASWRTSHSLRELIILGIVFGIEPVRQFLAYVSLDSLEGQEPQSPRKSFIKQLEQNIFEPPRR